MEAKPFEPQAEILLPTSDAMLAFIGSELLTHPELWVSIAGDGLPVVDQHKQWFV